MKMPTTSRKLDELLTQSGEKSEGIIYGSQEWYSEMARIACMITATDAPAAPHADPHRTNDSN